MEFQEENQESKYERKKPNHALISPKVSGRKGLTDIAINRKFRTADKQPKKIYRAIQDIYINKKPLLALRNDKGLTTNEEKTTETFTQYNAKMFTRITQQQMPEPKSIPMSEPSTWKGLYNRHHWNITTMKAKTIMDFVKKALNMHQNKYIKI